MSDERRIERIETKIDDIKGDISSINSTLSAQHESLKEHMRRTDVLESEFKPIRRQSLMLAGVCSFVLLCAAIAGILELVIKLKGL